MTLKEAQTDPTKVKGFENDAAAQKIAEEALKAIRDQDGRPVAISFTIHGEVIVRQFLKNKISPDAVDALLPKGKDTDPFERRDDPLGVVDYEDPGISEELKGAMLNIFEATKQIHALPRREVPLTRGELDSVVHVTKKELRKLVKKGLVTEKLLRLNASKTGKAVRAQAVLYFTPQGRAYATKHFNKQYYKGIEDGRADNSKRDNNVT